MSATTQCCAPTKSGIQCKNKATNGLTCRLHVDVEPSFEKKKICSCSALTKQNTQCKNAAKENGFCATHAPDAPRRTSSTKGKKTAYAVFAAVYAAHCKEEGIPYNAKQAALQWEIEKEDKTELYHECVKHSDYPAPK